MNKLKLLSLYSLLAAFFFIGCQQTPQPQSTETQTSATAPGELDRTSLPIKEPKRPTHKELDVRDLIA